MKKYSHLDKNTPILLELPTSLEHLPPNTGIDQRGLSWQQIKLV